MLVPLLLLAAAPADFGTSSLVDAAHAHDWARLADDDDAALYWDRNFVSARTFDGVRYPLVLFRGIGILGDKGPEFGDILSAIDCSGARIGMIAMTWSDGVTGEGERKDSSSPQFDEMPDIDAPRTQAMMRAVCGEDWAP